MDANVLRYLYPPKEMTREQLETVVEELRGDCAALRDDMSAMVCAGLERITRPENINRFMDTPERG